ncbi:hypothetical protein EMEDMD4_520084 [Sinorhizobium medicae]|uniref:Uncharacterized protein n=1 Tax=Sinorhizobium medicae TaxID=110321 RepID=A0A508X6V2_9HYPH|nr:hypothetical protein EMEDMD4_520084 [Sinorhizobium medicae]
MLKNRSTRCRNHGHGLRLPPARSLRVLIFRQRRSSGGFSGARLPAHHGNFLGGAGANPARLPIKSTAWALPRTRQGTRAPSLRITCCAVLSFTRRYASREVETPQSELARLMLKANGSLAARRILRRSRVRICRTSQYPR